jgi:hypothetical protein
MKNIFAILFVVLFASCGAPSSTEEVVETDSTAVEVVETPEVVDTTVVDTTAVAQ